ncbi:MAG: alpha/beta hydrolase [Paludibacter sp.]
MKTMKRMKWVILFSLLFTINALAQTNVLNLPIGYTKQIDVVYKQVKDWQGRMDIYLPPKQDKPAPVVFLIHGGAWRQGNKESYSGFGIYFKLGFAVVNVEYRLSSQGVAPAAVEDVRCSMLYMVNHADSFNIDRNKIVFSGSSAGAHLALLAGFTASNKQFDNDCQQADNFKIAAVIAQSTPSTLYETLSNGETKVLNDGAIFEWLGDKKNDVTFAKLLSPITYVSKDNPPVFITHGDADKRVPYQQSVNLDKKLTEAGVKHTFITIPGGGHGGYTKEKQNEIKEAIVVFLKENVLK